MTAKRDSLYVLCETLAGSNTVCAFSGTSSIDFNGDVAATREIIIEEIDTASQIYVTPDDTLYVAGRGVVLASEMASTKSGQVDSDRPIIGFGGSLVRGLYVDPNDTFYALSINSSSSTISRVVDISTVEGDAMVDARIIIENTSFEKELVLDNDGNAYFSATATVQIFEDVA